MHQSTQPTGSRRGSRQHPASAARRRLTCRSPAWHLHLPATILLGLATQYSVARGLPPSCTKAHNQLAAEGAAGSTPLPLPAVASPAGHQHGTCTFQLPSYWAWRPSTVLLEVCHPRAPKHTTNWQQKGQQAAPRFRCPPSPHLQVTSMAHAAFPTAHTHTPPLTNTWSWPPPPVLSQPCTYMP